jgi:hypothetical protein
MKSLNIPKRYTEVINRRRTGNTMTKRKKDKRTIIYKTQHRKLQIDQHERH